MGDIRCLTCGAMGESTQAMSWHPFRHALRTDAGASWAASVAPSDDNKPDVSVVRGPHDPVLRQALIDKGVLTADDLRNAEAKILIVSGQFHEAVRAAIAEEVKP